MVRRGSQDGDVPEGALTGVLDVQAAEGEDAEVKQSTASDYLTEARAPVANGYGAAAQEHQEHAHA
ncbi:hypothetical protein ACFYPN_32530 [Streptomyces sp. NPDC005576]|uniref:hypothetical protein n=1 Tax=Streptomyces sp. NPDC005576 TaxID=3364726 RepID=UPI0036976E59